MKKVLILAYDFPPYNSIGGQRPYSWFKYFKEFGFFPVVVTRHWDESITTPEDYMKPSTQQEVSVEEYEEGVVYRVPYRPNARDRFSLKYGTNSGKIIRKMLSVWYMCTEFCIPFFDAKYGIYKTALNVCKKDEFSYIIATGEPFILFKYASKISRKTAVPWIADYRDGWSTNYNYSAFQRMFFSGIEKSILTSAVFFTSISSAFVAHLLKLHTNKKSHVIMNGYSENEYSLKCFSQNNKIFTLSFVGTLYFYQEIDMLAEALKLCDIKILNNIKIQWIGLNFYPEQKKRIITLFEQMPIKHVFTERLPQKDVMKYLKQSSLLLLPASTKYIPVYAKLFDYLQAGRKIILFPSDKGTVEQIIRHTESGEYFHNYIELYHGFKKLYKEWKKTGQVLCATKNIEQYSRKNQAHKFVQILQDMN